MVKQHQFYTSIFPDSFIIQKLQISSAGLDFSQKKMDWEQLVKNIFITQGLNKVLPLLQKIQNGAPSLTASLLNCFVSAILLFLPPQMIHFN